MLQRPSIVCPVGQVGIVLGNPGGMISQGVNA